MVRIRLRRVGSKNQPSFRIVAAEKEAPRDGRFLEVLGHYNPRTEPSTISVDEGRLFHWMKNGAQPSESVTQALRALGTWERWERYKQGESLEKLLEEAKKAIPEVDPRTRRDDLFGKSKKKKSKKADKEPVQAAADEAVVEEIVQEQEPAEAEAPAAPVEEVEEAAVAESSTEADASKEGKDAPDVGGSESGDEQADPDESPTEEESEAASDEKEESDEA